MDSTNPPLKHPWMMYSHNIRDVTHWGMETYIPIWRVATADEFWILWSALGRPYLSTGMYFFMKEGVEPRYEEEHNRKGGSWSIKVPREQIDQCLQDVAVRAVCGALFTDPSYNEGVCGLTISPKLNFCILKIWNADFHQSALDKFDPDLKWFQEGVLYRPHEILP